MNSVWKWCVVSAIVYGMMTKRSACMEAALLSTGEEAVGMTVILISIMTLWSGLLEILAVNGDLSGLGRLMCRFAAPVFGGLKDEACWEAMGTNLAANLLGLGNAATPAGVRAAQLLAERGPQGLRALSALLVLNNAGLQLLPTTVITMRQTAGSASAGDVWLPALAASAASAAAGLLALRVIVGREGGQGT